MSIRMQVFSRRGLRATAILMVALATATGHAQSADPAATGDDRANETARYETIRVSKPDGTVVTLRVPESRPLIRRGARQVRQSTGSPARYQSAEDQGEAGTPDHTEGSIFAPHGFMVSHPTRGRFTMSPEGNLAELMIQSTAPARLGGGPIVAGDDPTEWRTGRGWAPGDEDGEGGDYLSAAEGEFIVLEPGPGWSGPTDDPPPVGDESMPGWDAKAIARWDVVPYQTITEDFEIGVVAFHINGIDRVVFSVNDGPWVAVREMQLNPRTGVWEYTAILHPEYFEEDGPIEVRAVVFPGGAGVPRVLAGERDSTTVDLGEYSLFMSTDFMGTLPEPVAYVSVSGSDSLGDGTEQNPFRSIVKAAKALETISGTGLADGGTVYLLPGEYQWGPAYYDHDGEYVGLPTLTDRFLTVTTAPGVSRDLVTISAAGSSGLLVTLLHVKGLHWTVLVNNAVRQDTHPLVWVDDCVFTGESRTDPENWISNTKWTGGRFITDSLVSNARYGFNSSIHLGRGLTVQDTGDDAFTNPGLLVDCLVTGIRAPDGSGFHSDVVQFHSSAVPIQNRIIYGLRALDCDSQGWHIAYTGHDPGPDWQDIAFVNVLLDAANTKQWYPSANHVLWWNLTVLNGPLLIRNTTGDDPQVCRIHNFSMRNCVFNVFSIRDDDEEPSLADQSWASTNHFIDIDTYGSVAVGADRTTGGPLTTLFHNPADRDFRANAYGPLAARDRALLTAADVFGWPLLAPAAIGAAQPDGTVE